MRHVRRRPSCWPALVLVASFGAACGDGEPRATAGIDSLSADSAPLTAAEEESFRVDPTRYVEMDDGRLDTVDMTARSDGAAWQIQAMNYAPSHIALTYAAWYNGPDSLALFAADGQPHLVDDLGNVYPGHMVPDNPRIKVENGTTAVGVYLFEGPVAERADSLTLVVNDSTPPIIRVGPFGVRHEPGSAGLRTRSGSGGTSSRD